MNKKRTSMHLGIGAPSLLMIFVILVMCVLAVLSYLKANAFYEGAMRHLHLTAQYYETEEKVLDIYYQLRYETIEQQLQQTKMAYQKDGDIYTLIERINDQTVLELKFQIDNHKNDIISLKSVDLEDTYGR